MDLIYIILIVITVVISIPIIYGLVLPFVKPKLSQTGSVYLYAFSSGFFVVLGIFGFLSEAKEELGHWYHDNSTPEWQQWLISIVILALGTVLVLTSSLGVKYLLMKKVGLKSNEHPEHEGHKLFQQHNHDELIYNPNDVDPKSKLFAILLLLAHKIPGGLILGFLISNIYESQKINLTNVMFLITFVLHIIPEGLIIFYRQIDVGISKWKATLNGFLGTMILIPFIFIGAYASKAIHGSPNFEITFAIVQVFVGAFFIYTAIIELIPEFLHHELTAKNWYFAMIFIILGMASCIAIFSVHSHAH